MKKITITGTKGKTTVSNVLASVLSSFEPKVLHVDTNGAHLNGKLVIDKKISQVTWDVVPTVAPGRFLYLLTEGIYYDSAGLDHSNVPGAAVLEASLGCGTVSGLGYYGHDVGVFTNVYEDHLGSRPDLKTRKDIGESKKFIFSRTNRDGYAVFNADDDVICSLLKHCKEGVTLLPFGFTFKHFDLKKHLKHGGNALTVRDNHLVLLSGDKETKLLDVADVAWTFGGHYSPSVANLLAVATSLFAYFDKKLPNKVIEVLRVSKLDPYSGRLTELKNSKNVTILADYAHEKQSLKSIGLLAHRLKASPENKVIGVVRLAWDRDEPLIKDTASYIANDYDEFIVYDKIDGHWRQPSARYRTGQRQFTQEVGKISSIFSEALIKKRGTKYVHRILREDEAVDFASQIAKPGDVVVMIVNDDIKRSIKFIKDSFKADFV